MDSFLIVCVWMFCLNVCLYTLSIPVGHRAQNRVSDALELKLQVILSHFVNAGNQTQDS